jgi:hypothetical protein
MDLNVSASHCCKGSIEFLLYNAAEETHLATKEIRKNPYIETLIFLFPSFHPI